MFKNVYSDSFKLFKKNWCSETFRVALVKIESPKFDDNQYCSRYKKQFEGAASA